MATAACHSAKADRFLRRARDPTAGNPPDAAAEVPRPPSPHPGHKPLPHPGRRCAAACAARPRPQSLMHRYCAIPAGTTRNPAAFAANACRAPIRCRPDSAMATHYTSWATIPY